MRLRIFDPPVETFEDYVKRCARDEEPDAISNASIRHAKIIVRELFKSAIKNIEPVYIVSGKLDRDFYRDLVGKAQQVLEQSRIEIIILDADENDMEGNELFELVSSHNNGTVIAHSGLTEHHAHFVLVGNRRYRVETDDGRKDAIACFNNPSVGQVLTNAFNNYREQLRE